VATDDVGAASEEKGKSTRRLYDY